MSKSERLELQRQLTNAESKFLKYRGSGVIPTPKALRYRRIADGLRQQITRMDREAAEQYAIAQTPIEDIIEVMIVPLLADVMNDIVAGVDASLRRNGISGTVYGIFTQQIRKCSLALVDVLAKGDENIPLLLECDDEVVDAIRKKLIAYVKKHCKFPRKRTIKPQVINKTDGNDQNI